MQFRSVVFAAVALCAMTASMQPGALARRRPSVAGTGLAAIHFAQSPPDFAFETPRGAGTLAGLVGRPVVINFWATWCEPCRDEAPAFATLRETYRDAVPLVTVSEDAVPGAAAAFLAAHGVDAIAVDDPQRHIFERYGVVPIPVTLVLGTNGTVTHVSVGELDWLELQTAVSAALPGLTPHHGSDTVVRNAGTRGP